MKPKKYNVHVTGEFSTKSKQRGDRATEKYKGKSTSTYEDGSSTTIKDWQKSTTNNKGKNRTRARSVALIKDSEGKLLSKQVDKGSDKTRVRVTRRGYRTGKYQ